MDLTPIFIFAWLILAVILIVYFQLTDLDDQLFMVLLAPVFVVLMAVIIPIRFFSEKFSTNDGDDD